MLVCCLTEPGRGSRRGLDGVEAKTWKELVEGRERGCATGSHRGMRQIFIAPRSPLTSSYFLRLLLGPQSLVWLSSHVRATNWLIEPFNLCSWHSTLFYSIRNLIFKTFESILNRTLFDLTQLG